MYALTYQIRPKVTHPQYGTYGEDGYREVTAWVNKSDRDAAEAAAREAIDQNGWDVQRLDETCRVDIDTYKPGSAGRYAVDRAQSEGLLLEFGPAYPYWPMRPLTKAEKVRAYAAIDPFLQKERQRHLTAMLFWFALVALVLLLNEWLGKQ